MTSPNTEVYRYRDISVTVYYHRHFLIPRISAHEQTLKGTSPVIDVDYFGEYFMLRSTITTL